MSKNTVAVHVEKELRSLADPVKSKLLAGFFKTGKGEYGEGDVFLGITVPVQRAVAKKFCTLQLSGVSGLLKSPIHECRLTALEILVMQYEKAKRDENTLLQKKVVTFYLKHTKYINNWDLVDLSASYILGDWLYSVDRAILYDLVKSKNVWERRIAIVSTSVFIRNNDFADILKLTIISLKDKHDLIHKAVGWMLREVGKRDLKVLVEFLDARAHEMPRTMLRYAIEKFPESQRKAYLMKS
jgi:3-methyladenine DNA glycosylase AlkD